MRLSYLGQSPLVPVFLGPLCTMTPLTSRSNSVRVLNGVVTLSSRESHGETVHLCISEFDLWEVNVIKICRRALSLLRTSSMLCPCLSEDTWTETCRSFAEMFLLL